MNQKRTLENGARQLGLKVGKNELALLDRYTHELIECSKRVNLTGHKDRESIEVFHYLDSLSLFQTGLVGPGLSLLDVGSGAGFPGLPLKIFEPTLDLTLLESSERRGAFLRYMVRILDITGVRVEVARAEDFAGQCTTAFDRIVCRAVGSIGKVCSWTAPLLGSGGLFVFQKSRRATKETRETEGHLRDLGLEVREVRPLEVPYLDRPRFAVIVGKINN